MKLCRALGISITAALAAAQAPYDWSSGTATLTVLDTDSTAITPVNGPPYVVTGGVFVFRNVTINVGTTVRGVGSKPMIWVVTGDMRIDGTLSVRGGDGQHRTTRAAAHVPTPGGSGVCGGGNGGRGSLNTGGYSGPAYPATEAGYGPGQVWQAGGGGGLMACQASCGRGSGGGGGSFATRGDPWFPTAAGPGTSFIQRSGAGGQGCSGASGSGSRSLAGGVAGTVPFFDPLPGNDFWGRGFDVASRAFVFGEMATPTGGQGGGGGGSQSYSSICSTVNPNWINDFGGGGGGGGGGVLVVACAGKIVIGATGAVDANGGDGGGGEVGGGSGYGGGGGGGSGGMVILYAGNYLEIAVKGETFANGDHAFSIAADVGVGRQLSFSGPQIDGKYVQQLPAPSWDANPAGGFGGLGVVELMTLPGNNASDGTNTLLDDNIHIVKNGARVYGTEKQRYLAWRGYPNAAGVLVDDYGAPTNATGRDGDIRPLPILLPILR